MEDAANTSDDPDLAALTAYGVALADAVVGAVPRWVERSVAGRYEAWRGEPPPPELAAASRAAASSAVAALEPALRYLLAQDPDEQRANPLAVLRRAVAWPTEVLRGAGVPPVARDPQAQRLFPEDVYDLSPAAFADVDPALHEPGLVWGAAKAHVLLARRRADGRR